ncbi:hypothetical protein F7U73_07595 [Vibrio vulnificus]|nr:hypothetical protein [Vibrio vulnificus]
MEQTAKIYKCKSCKGTVQKDAKKCPHCGEKYPTVSNAKGCLGFLVMVIVGSLVIGSCVDNKAIESPVTIEAEQLSYDQQMEKFIQFYAVDYQVTRSVDLSHASRTRYNSNIFAPKALSHEQQIATAAKAAKDIQLTQRVQVSSVNIMIEKDGAPKLSVSYAPDQKGWVGDKNLGQRFILE